MRVRDLLAIGVMIVAVMLACAGLGILAGRSAARRAAPVQGSSVLGLPVNTPSEILHSRRIRLYFGPRIEGEPAFTIVAGRVYRGNALDQAFLTLDQQQVYSGSGTSGPLLYRFTDNQILAGTTDGPAQFVQRDNTMYFGPDPQAPALFTFEGTQVYRGDPAQGHVLATSNTVLTDPDLVKLISIVLYMETLE